MKNIIETETPASIYALLIRSEEKARTFSEVAVYFLLVGCTVLSIWHCAHQPISVPAVLIQGEPVAHTAAARPAQRV